MLGEYQVSSIENRESSIKNRVSSIETMKPIYREYFIRAALVWAGCFVLFFLVHMLVLAPQKRSKKQIEKQLAEKKQMYNSVLKATQKESRIQLSRQIEYLRSKLEDFVIDFEDSANLTFDISQIADEKKVASFSIKPKDRREAPAMANCNYISENYIEIGFAAGFNQFATFLNALERHRPVVFVDGFTITRSDRNKSDNQVDMNLAVFVRKRQDS